MSPAGSPSVHAAPGSALPAPPPPLPSRDPAHPRPAPAAGAESAGVLRSARVMSGGTLLSRVLGLLRDAVTAHLLGAGAAADAFAVAFRIPNLLREILGEGALTSAFLPVYAGRKAEGDGEAATRLFRTTFTLLVGVLSLLSAGAVAFFLLVPPGAFAPEDPAKTALLLELSAWCFPYAVLVCASALFAAVLQAEGRFGIPALAPAAMNAAWIAASLLLQPAFGSTPEGRARAVAAAVLVAGVAQAALALPALRRLDLLPRATLALRDPALRAMLRRMAPAVLGLAPVQVNLLLNALMAEALVPGDGANSALWYSSRLLQLPLALVGVSLGVAAFPTFARMAAEGRRGDLGRAAAASLRTTLLLSVPAAAGLAALGVPVATALFAHGRFRPEDADAVAAALRCALVGLPAFCALQVMTRLFHSLGDTGTPVRVGAWSVVLCFALNLALVGPMEERGLALSTALTAWGNFLALLFIARRRHRVRGLRSLGGTGMRSALAGAACGGAAFLAAAAAGSLLPGSGNAAMLAASGAGVAAGAGAWLAATALLRDPDAADLRAALARRAGV
ncbi:MAG: murein biosynthesis integral membrane protein MurJ [Planctomycetes bacterium]|nr:murein biosynthesis integral membrane protein MurJ [Planctomycetota bacterium]